MMGWIPDQYVTETAELLDGLWVIGIVLGLATLVTALLGVIFYATQQDERKQKLFREVSQSVILLDFIYCWFK